MTEMAEGISPGQDNQSLPPAPSSPAPESQASSDDRVLNERVFKQSEVNDIVKKAKYGAVEDYKRISTQQPAYAQQKYGEQQAYPTPPANALPEEHVRKLAAEEFQRTNSEIAKDAQQKYNMEQAQRVLNTFREKAMLGKDKYQDYEAMVGDIDYSKFTNVVSILADYVDNAHDILYELGRDRFKLVQLEQLAERSPHDAIAQAKRMSKAIKDNESASRYKIPNEPLSQLRPSNTGTDNGVMGVKDYRSKYRV